MDSFRKSFPNYAVYAMGMALAYFSAQAIVNPPGISVSKWIFALGPIGLTLFLIVAVMVGAVYGWSFADVLFTRPAPAGPAAKVACLLGGGLAGLFVAFNPFDFITPIFLIASLVLLLLSFVLLLAGRRVDAIGALLFAMPLLPYLETELNSAFPGLVFEWFTLKSVFVALVAVSAFATRKGLSSGKWIAERATGLASALLLAALLSSMNSEEPLYSLHRWVFENLLPVSALFLVMSSVRSEDDIPRLLAYLVASVTFGSVVILYYFAKYGAATPTLAPGPQRLSLIFVDGTLFANTVLQILPFSVAFIAMIRTPLLRLFPVVSLLICWTGLIVTFVRTAQITGVLCILSFAMRSNLRRVSLVILAGFACAFAAFPDHLIPYLHKYRGLDSLGDVVHASTMEKRYGGWKAALLMTADHPLLGVGTGRFRREYPKYGSLYYAEWAGALVPMNSAHNFFLNILAENGLIGLVLFLAVFFAVFRAALGNIRRSTRFPDLTFSLALAIGLFAFNNLIDGLTMSFLNEFSKGFFFWFVAGLILSQSRALATPSARARGEALPR